MGVLMVRIHYTVLIGLLCSGALYAVKKDKAYGPGFSLLNKSKKIIYVYVENENKEKISIETMSRRAVPAQSLMAINETIEELQNQSSGGYSQKSPKERTQEIFKYKDQLFINEVIAWQTTSSIVHIFERDGTEIYRAEFPAGKTIYVHWDGTEFYPQTGPLRGLQGTTDQGFSLRKNIKKSDITVLPIDKK